MKITNENEKEVTELMAVKPLQKVLIFEFRNAEKKLKRIQIANLRPEDDIFIEDIETVMQYIAENSSFNWGKVEPVRAYTKRTEVDSIIEVD